MHPPASPLQVLQGRVIGVDARDLAVAPGSGSTGTGIATYARGVLQAVARLGGQAELFTAAAPGGSPATPLPDRVARALAAPFWPLASTVTDRADPQAPVPQAPAPQTSVPQTSVQRLRLAPDAFRLAQMHLDIWRRALPCRGRSLPDVMHWTSALPLRLRGVPNIVTLHDAIPLRRPNRTGTDPRRYRRLLRAVASAADHILTVSEASRRELEAVLPDVAGRLTVIPEAVDLPPELFDPDATARRARAVSLFVGQPPGDYYIHAGSIEPRKNIAGLLRAFLASGVSRPLILAGPDGWRAEQELAPFAGQIGPVQSGARIIRLGYVDRTILLHLIQGARALLYPSLAEGFGLPILEAMGLGTPVLTSRGGATGEVAGDAALLVDPDDAAELEKLVAWLDRDDTLCTALRHRGLARAALFTPALFAERLGRFYESVLSAQPQRARLFRIPGGGGASA